MEPPITRKTWPVMPADSSLPSQATSGAIFSGAARSNVAASTSALSAPRLVSSLLVST
jgi:hypothetical protein